MPNCRPPVQTAAVLLLSFACLLPAAEPDWQMIECIPLDLPADVMYQATEPIETAIANEVTWKAVRGGQNAQATLLRDTSERHSGEAAIRVDYEFVGKTDYEYLQLGGPAEFSEPGMGIGFWLKHNGTPFTLRWRITDASGENHQLELRGSGEPGWQFVVGTLDGHSSAWGGDGNRRIDYPCRLSGIVFDRPYRAYTGKGSLWIDQVSMVKPRKLESRQLTVEMQKKRFGNLFAVGETIALRASGTGDQIRWTARDFSGRVLAQGEGAASDIQARFTMEHPGWYACTIELLADGRLVNARMFVCAALAGGNESARSDFVGVCSHFGQNKYPLETMNLMQRYGIDQYRDEIGWRSFELQPGQYALPKYAAAFLDRSAQLKMRPLLIFDYSNPHYDDGGFPNSPEAIAGFGAYATDLARRTRGTVSMFEVWNEWIGGCGMKQQPGIHDGQAYGRLLKPTYQTIKSEFPELTLVGIGGEYGVHCADNILAAVGSAGPDAMDAWSIHPYRYPNSPESSDLVGEVTRIAEQVADAGVKTKAWITEIGYPTHRTSRGTSLAQQASHCVRSLVLLQSTRSVEKVFWYDLKDDGLSRDYNEHNFGLVHHQHFNCAPKPGIVAMSVFVRMTEGAEFRMLKQSGDSYAAHYRDGNGRDLIIAWATEDSPKLQVEGRLDAVYGLMGAACDQQTEIEVSEAPIYLFGNDLQLKM